MSIKFKTIFAAAVLATLTGPQALAQTSAAPAKPAPPPQQAVSHEEIAKAIQAGVQALFAKQDAKGLWDSSKPTSTHISSTNGSIAMIYPSGNSAIALLTLETTGIDLKDARYQKGLKALCDADIQSTYEVSLRTMLLSRIVRRSKDNSAEIFRKILKRDAHLLVTNQQADGGWTYNSPQLAELDRSDLSNTQMAVLALSEAVAAGIEVPPPVFEKVQALLIKSQIGDGGWCYMFVGPHTIIAPAAHHSYGSMTAAAVASLFITRDLLTPQVGCPCNGEHSQHSSSPADLAITRGIKWLGENFVPNKNPKSFDSWAGDFSYWLYAVERVGLASGYKYLGPHDWYGQGATQILHAHAFQGAGPLGFPDSCFSLMFLVKGQAPILMNKLQFDGDWNLHPRDLANAVHYVGVNKETPVQFQIINLDSSPAEWHDAPILYISAEGRIPITPEQKQKLKTFTDTGGTILFEASCGNGLADRWLRDLAKELWPGYEFRAVTKEHPLWTADQRLPAAQPKLLGLSDGLRTFLFYSPYDISCAWSRNQFDQEKNTFALAGNLYAYATDKASLRSRAAMHAPLPAWYTAAKIQSGPRATLKIARLRTGGDYATGASYQAPENYNKARDPAAPKLDPQPTVSASASNLADLDVLWLTGRQDASLEPAEAQALKAWLDNGGFLFAEATMGDPRFGKSFTALAKTLGLTLKPQSPTDDLIVGKPAPNVSGYNLSKVRFTAHLAPDRLGLSHPDLQLIYLGDKLVGVWSPYDVMFSLTGFKAYGNLGYESDDARAIATNVFLLAGAGKK